MPQKILFLGPDDSPVLHWLKEREARVTATCDKISPAWVEENEFDFLVSYGYRHILKEDILNLVPDRAVNLHISFLPSNRGADPNLWSFVDNTPKGVTIHYMDSGIDTGDIIAQKEVFFESNEETLGTSYQMLQEEIQQLFYRNWDLIKQMKNDRQPQAGPGSFHRKKDKDGLMYLFEKDGWNTRVSQLVNQQHGAADSGVQL